MKTRARLGTGAVMSQASSFDEVDEKHPHRVQNLRRRLIERLYRPECGTTLSFGH